MARRVRDDASFWISYSDLATGLLLIFILLVAVYINRAAATQQQLIADQEKVEHIQEEIDSLLGRRDELARRLQSASEQANEEIASQVFAYDPVTQTVVVQMDDTEVAWFETSSARLRPDARGHIRAFYRALYEHMMCADPSLPSGTHRCVDRTPAIPPFLEAIEITGHTDVTFANGDQPDWSWIGFNAGAEAGNLSLSQSRAKAIVDEIQALYQGGQGANAVNDTRYPWRPFMALVHTSGRAWMEAYCPSATGELETLEPEDFFEDPPCRYPEEALRQLHERSRRVSFSFRLDDKEILQRLQALTREVAALGRPAAAEADP